MIWLTSWCMAQITLQGRIYCPSDLQAISRGKHLQLCFFSYRELLDSEAYPLWSNQHLDTEKDGAKRPGHFDLPQDNLMGNICPRASLGLAKTVSNIYGSSTSSSAHLAFSQLFHRCWSLINVLYPKSYLFKLKYSWHTILH